MAGSRIIYQDWIVELGYDPAQGTGGEKAHGAYNEKIILAVNKALEQLHAGEADFIRRYYFQGQSYRQIADETGRPTFRLESLHTRAVKKLRKHLFRQLRGCYGIPSPKSESCIICTHRLRNEMESIIKNKAEEETWRRIIRKLRRDFGVNVISPQQLISHVKYHMI